MSDTLDTLDALEPRDAPVFEPVDGATVTAHRLIEESTGPVLFHIEVEADAGVLAAIETLELVDVANDGVRFEVAPKQKPPARGHNRARDAIGELGGDVVERYP